MNSPLVFFDIDQVLIKKQTQELFLKLLIEKRKIALWRGFLIYLWFLLYKMGLTRNVIGIRKFAFKTFSGWSQGSMHEVIAEFSNEIVSKHLNYKIIERLKRHQSRGDVVVLLSATLKEIADNLANKLNVRWTLATELEINNNKYTGEIDGEIPYGCSKAEFVRNFIASHHFSLEGSYAYADHISDLPVLQMVEKAVVVNPSRQLKAIAELEEWEIIIV